MCGEPSIDPDNPYGYTEHDLEIMALSDEVKEDRAIARQNSQLQNPYAYTAGRITQMTVTTMTAGAMLSGSGLVEEVASIAGGGKLATALTEVGLETLLVDVPTDTIPEMIANFDSGMSVDEVLKQAGINVLVNTGVNILGDIAILGALEGGAKILGDTGVDKALGDATEDAFKVLGDGAEDTLKTSSDALDGVADSLKLADDALDAGKAIPDVSDTAKVIENGADVAKVANNGSDVAKVLDNSSDAAEAIGNSSDVAKAIDNGTDAAKTINNGTDTFKAIGDSTDTARAVESSADTAKAIGNSSDVAKVSEDVAGEEKAIAYVADEEKAANHVADNIDESVYAEANVDNTLRPNPLTLDVSGNHISENGANTEIILPSKPHKNGTEGHWETILDEVNNMKQSGEYEKIYVNKGLSNEIPKASPNRRPDIMGV